MKRLLLGITVTLIGSLLASGTLYAQGFPTKPIRIIVPFAPGGGADASGRLAAKLLGARMSQGVIVENRPGANGAIGIDFVAKSAPDGHTLVVVSNGFTIGAATEKGQPFDPKKDLKPVLVFGEQALVLVVSTATPAANAQELAQLARSRPGTLSFAGSDPSTILATDMFRKSIKADFMTVPYKGAGQALVDVLGGQITGVITSFSTVLSQIKAGKVRGIAVTTMTRSPLAPELPTLNESIAPGYEFASWFGLFAPSATPREAMQKLNGELSAALQSPEGRDQFGALGFAVLPESLERAGERIARDFAKWEAVAKAAGLAAQ